MDPYDFILHVDCSRNDWTSRDGYSTCYSETNPGDGCHETGATGEIFEAWTFTGSDLFWSAWG